MNYQDQTVNIKNPSFELNSMVQEDFWYESVAFKF